MTAAVLLDADVPPAVGDALRQRGYDVVAAAGNVELEGLNDVELLRAATREGRLLVTFNIADSVEVTRGLAHRHEDHAEIVLIHARSFPRTQIGAIAKALDGLLQSREDFGNSVLFLSQA